MRVARRELPFLLMGIVCVTEFPAAPSALRKGRMRISRPALAAVELLAGSDVASGQHGSQC